MFKVICVCGAGTMGSGIAQVAAKAGFKTILFDVDDDILSKSKEFIIKSLTALEQKGKISLTEKELQFNRIRFESNINNCKADVIIEAIVEKLEAKVLLFNQLSNMNSTETILATNTSSLSISDLAAQIEIPGRVVGMHFFNPAQVMKLVEVVNGTATTSTVSQLVCELAEQMGKTPVICKDRPGFIVNRIARHYYLEALKLVEEGVANVETIDAVLQSAGFKMGPFKLMDLIGMDINFNVTNNVWEALGKPERLRPSSMQKAKVKANELGRKTGKGFYEY